MTTRTKASMIGDFLAGYSRAEMKLMYLPVETKTLRTGGFYERGDKGEGAFYMRVNAEPAFEEPVLADNPLKLRTADRFLANGTSHATNGGWWLLATVQPHLGLLGAKGDFDDDSETGTDDGDAIEAAITLRCVFVPAGMRCFTDRKFTRELTDDIAIVGMGRGVSEIVFGTNALTGFEFFYQSNKRHAVSLQHLTISTTRDATSGCPIFVRSDGVFTYRTQLRFSMDNVQFKGVDVDTQGWATGPILYDVNFCNITDSFFTGLGANNANGGQADIVSSVGLWFQGNIAPTEMKIRNYNVYYAIRAVYGSSGTFEGAYFTDCTFVGVEYGVDWDNTYEVGHPLFNWQGGHISAFRNCLRVRGTSAVHIGGGPVFYIMDGLQIGTHVEINDAYDVQVVNLLLYSYAFTQKANGIRVMSGVLKAVIDNIHVISEEGDPGDWGFSAGVWIDGAVDTHLGRVISRGTFETAVVVDTGTGTVVELFP